MILLEFDKAGAEWVVVAYLANDARMIDVVENGKSPHIITGALISGAPEELVKRESKLVDKSTDADLITKLREPIAAELAPFFVPRSMSIRQMGKKSNHGLNYDEGYRTFALTNEIEEREAKIIVEKYHEGYPGIRGTFHTYIVDCLKKDRTLTNCFDRKVTLLDEWGDSLKKAAISFIPQSTIVDIVNKSMILAYNDTTPAFRPIDLLNQSHDSVTFQYPVNDWMMMADFAVRYAFDYMNPELEYNQRRFKVGTDLKVGTSWGHMKEVRLEPNAQAMAGHLREAWERLNGGEEDRRLAEGVQ